MSLDRAPIESRARIAGDNSARRGREHACALDFLVYGDDEGRGRHKERCVHGERSACSRDYDPMPYDEAEPVDIKLYEGTAIGALYDLSPFTGAMAAELRGWNLKPRTVYE